MRERLRRYAKSQRRDVFTIARLIIMNLVVVLVKGLLMLLLLLLLLLLLQLLLLLVLVLVLVELQLLAAFCFVNNKVLFHIGHVQMLP